MAFNVLHRVISVNVTLIGTKATEEFPFGSSFFDIGFEGVAHKVP